MTIVSIGEILWDVFSDSERLGGAPFNFAVHAHRLGHRVIFLSAVGDDARGLRARQSAADLGLPVEFLQTIPGAATGHVSVFVDPRGQPDFTVHRPAAYDALHLSDAVLAQIQAADPDWLYFGTLIQTSDHARRQVTRLMDALPRARRFYDVNLRRGCYTPVLVRELMAIAHAVKLNEDEAREFPDSSACTVLSITRGDRGCTVRIGADTAECPGYPVQVADTVGSGDAFAAAFLHGIGSGWSAARTGDFANRLGALVASQPGAIPRWTLQQMEHLSQDSSL